MRRVREHWNQHQHVSQREEYVAIETNALNEKGMGTLETNTKAGPEEYERLGQTSLSSGFWTNCGYLIKKEREVRRSQHQRLCRRLELENS